MTALSGTLVEIAADAYRLQEDARSAERSRWDEQRQDQEREENDAALTRALQAPLVRWFPGVAWELVDRRLPHGALVVRDPESGLLFRVVASGGPWEVDLVEAAGQRPKRDRYRTLARGVTGPADVGRWLKDQQRRAQARQVPAESEAAAP